MESRIESEQMGDNVMKTVDKPISNRGFTLIEILVAVFLLVTAILGVISTTVIIIKSNALSKSMTTATTLAKDKMEQLKNTGYNDLLEGTDYANMESTVQETSAADSIYTRTWIVNSDSPAEGMKTITVTVQWNWQSALHNVILTTIMAK
jgi:type IV pilus assembly protein PilV